MTKREELLSIMNALISTGRHYYPDKLIHETFKTWEAFNQAIKTDEQKSETN